MVFQHPCEPLDLLIFPFPLRFQCYNFLLKRALFRSVVLGGFAETDHELIVLLITREQSLLELFDRQRIEIGVFLVRALLDSDRVLAGKPDGSLWGGRSRYDGGGR